MKDKEKIRKILNDTEFKSVTEFIQFTRQILTLSPIAIDFLDDKYSFNTLDL